MKLREYVDGLVRQNRSGTPRYDEARRDYLEAMRQRTRSY